MERIFREEGVIDESENESDTSEQVDPLLFAKKSTNPEQWEDEIIGHMETQEGTPLGQLVIVNKAKGRGRPKGCISAISNIFMVQYNSTRHMYFGLNPTDFGYICVSFRIDDIIYLGNTFQYNMLKQ